MQLFRPLLLFVMATAELIIAKVYTGEDIGVKIIGTIASKQKQVVLLKVLSSGKVSAFNLGKKIEDKYTLKGVTNKYILVESKDQGEFKVYLDKFASSANTGRIAKNNNDVDGYSEDGFTRKGGEIRMTEAYRDKLVKEDLSKVLMEATALPYMQDGQIIGFQMSQIDEGSIYEKSGLKNFDVVTNINDVELNNVAGAIKLLKGLKNSTSIKVQVLRNGVEKSLTLSVE